MVYESIRIGYPGPNANFGSDASDKALSEAINQCNAILDALPIQWISSYCWPDGSLYRIIRYAGEDPKSRIREAFQATELRLVESGVEETPAKREAWERCSTVERFEEKYPT